jgi:hypothetical protein
MTVTVRVFCNLSWIDVKEFYIIVFSSLSLMSESVSEFSYQVLTLVSWSFPVKNKFVLLVTLLNSLLLNFTESYSNDFFPTQNDLKNGLES